MANKINVEGFLQVSIKVLSMNQKTKTGTLKKKNDVFNDEYSLDQERKGFTYSFKQIFPNADNLNEVFEVSVQNSIEYEFINQAEHYYAIINDTFVLYPRSPYGTTFLCRQKFTMNRLEQDDTFYKVRFVVNPENPPPTEPDMLKVIKKTFTYNQWQPNATGVGTINMNLGLDNGSIPISIKVKQSTSFGGGTTTDVVLDMTDQTNANAVNNIPLNVFNGVNDFAGGFAPCQNADAIPNQNSSGDYNLRLTVTGETIDNLVSGAVDVWVFYAVGTI